MGQPIKLIIKKGAVRKDGTSLIFVQYCYTADQRVLLSTHVSIPPNYWNKKTRRISENLPLRYGNAIELQLSITEKLRRSEDMAEYAIKKRNTCPILFLKENFSLHTNWKPKQMSDSTKCLDIYRNIDDYVESKRGTVKHCTINVINAMKAHLKSFESFRKEPITFDSFDMNFYEEFIKYLTYDIVHLRRKEVIKGLRVNSIGKTIKHLKSFLKDRMRKKIIPFMDLGDYKVVEEIVDAVYLNWQELSLIYHLDLTANSYLEKYRDLLTNDWCNPS